MREREERQRALGENLTKYGFNAFHMFYCILHFTFSCMIGAYVLTLPSPHPSHPLSLFVSLSLSICPDMPDNLNYIHTETRAAFPVQLVDNGNLGYTEQLYVTGRGSRLVCFYMCACVLRVYMCVGIAC